MRRRIGRRDKRCPAYPGKVTYRDQESASRALAVIQSHPARAQGKPTRSYECPVCGGFHLSSKEG